MQWKIIKKLKDSPFKKLTGVEPKTFHFMVKVLKTETVKKAAKMTNNRSRPFIYV